MHKDLTFNFKCHRLFHLAHLKGDGTAVLRCQVLQHELVDLAFMGDGVDLVGEEHLVVKEPLHLLICVVDLADKHCVTVFVHLYIGQVLGDLNVTHWVEELQLI